MQHRSFATFVGPTGALTEMSMSPGSAIFLGATHHVVGLGFTSPNPPSPERTGDPPGISVSVARRRLSEYDFANFAQFSPFPIIRELMPYLGHQLADYRRIQRFRRVEISRAAAFALSTTAICAFSRATMRFCSARAGAK